MSNYNPLISILVPVYGTEKYIRHCAESLLNQTYSNIEYIFVDDCSKDNSLSVLDEVLKEYPLRKSSVKIIRHNTNVGLAGARLTGLLHSKGDYIWFVDSDDYVERNTLELCKTFIVDKYDIIVFNYYSENNNIIRKSNIKSISPRDVLCNKVSPSIWKCIIKRDLFFKNNIFPVIGINYAEDFLLLGRLILVSKNNVIISQNLYHYNCNNFASYTANVNIKSLEDKIKVTKLIFQYYKSRDSVKDYKNSLCFMFSVAFLNLYFEQANNPLLFSVEREIKELSYPAYLFFLASKQFKTMLFIKIFIKLCSWI